MAEWLRRGLQILPSQFDSGRGLQEFYYNNARVILDSCYKLNYILFLTYSSVAQLVEQLTVNQLVAGSSPARGANCYPVFSKILVFFKTCNILSFCKSDKPLNIFAKKEKFKSSPEPVFGTDPIYS